MVFAFFDFDTIAKFLDFIVAAVTIGGFLCAGWKMVVKPLKGIMTKIDTLETTLNENLKTVNDRVLPVINSLSKEFSANSGKSIMDRILRIDDNTRLAELRSKLIASSLMTASMLEFDRMGNLIWCNKAFVDLTGLEFENLNGKGWLVCVEEDHRKRVVELWNESIREDIPFESEFEIKNQKNGNLTFVKCQVFPHKSVSHEKYNILGYYGTITHVV